MTHFFLHLALLANPQPVESKAESFDRLPHRVCGPLLVSPRSVVPDTVETAIEVAILTWTNLLKVAPFIQVTQQDLADSYGPARFMGPAITIDIISGGVAVARTKLVLLPDGCIQSAVVEVSHKTVRAGESKLIDLMIHELGIVLGIAHPFAPTEATLAETARVTGGMNPARWGGPPTFRQMMELIQAVR